VNPLIRDEVVITDLRSFLTAVRFASETLGGFHPMWRGHANIEWSLTPEVFRLPPIGGGAYPEITLIRTFMGQAESRNPRCPPSNDLLRWLILARHYGLPTRIGLVDESISWAVFCS
jgi:FRG domain